MEFFKPNKTDSKEEDFHKAFTIEGEVSTEKGTEKRQLKFEKIDGKYYLNKVHLNSTLLHLIKNFLNCKTE